MSNNPNDPKPKSPENPDEPKPADGTQAPDGAGGSMSRSSFEMTLPGAASYSDLPPVAQPDANDGSGTTSALPPRPQAARQVTGSFDFINIEDEIAALTGTTPALPTRPPLKTPVPTEADSGLPPAPKAPSTNIDIAMPSAGSVLIPTPNPADLPPAPEPEPLFTSTDDVIVLPPGQSAVPPAPMAFTISSSDDIDIGPDPGAPSSQIPFGVVASAPDVTLPDADEPKRPIPTGYAASAPDLDVPAPGPEPSAQVPSGIMSSSGDVDLDPPTNTDTASNIPLGFPASYSEVELTLPVAPPPASDVTPGVLTSSGDVDLGPPSGATPSSQVPLGFAFSSPDLDLGELPDLPPAPSDSGTGLPTTPSSQVPIGFAFSSPDLDLPIDERAVPEGLALSSADIDLDEVPDEPNVPSAPDIGTLYPTGRDSSGLFFLGEEKPPPRPPTEASTPDLPPLGVPMTDPSMGKVPGMGSSGEFGTLPPGQSVPDINVLFAPPGTFPAGEKAVPDFDLPPVPPDATGSSAGQYRVVRPSDGWIDPDAPTQSTDSSVSGPASSQTFGRPNDTAGDSDVFASKTAPDMPPGDSDVFAAVPKLAAPSGGSTLPDGDSDLPLAADLASDSDLLTRRTSDPESIHDIPDPVAGLPFDSSTLPDTSLPSNQSDSPNYGAAARGGPDASSILSDLTEPLGRSSDSSVQFDKPGMSGTVTGKPLAGFELTTDNEDVTGSLGDIELEQTGSDLLGSSSDRGRPDAGPTSDAPSSIFNRERPAPAGRESTDPELDEAEFTSRPAGGTSGEGVDMDVLSQDENATINRLIGGEVTDDSNETPLRPVLPDDSRPNVSVDWMAESAERLVGGGTRPTPAAKKPPAPEPAVDFTEKKTKPEAKPVAKDKPKAAGAKPARLVSDSDSAERLDPGADGAQKRKRESRSLITGALLGTVLMGGMGAAAYFGNVIPPRDTAEREKLQKEVQQQKQLVQDLQAKVQQPNGATIEKENDGGLFDRLRSLDGPAGKDDPELKKVRESLETVRAGAKGKEAAQATVRLGVTHLLAGDRAAARKLYESALTDYPAYRSTFEALLAKMAAEDAEAAGGGTSFNAPRRLTPAEAERLLLSVTVLLQDEAKKDAEPEEPGVYYWKAVKLAKEGSYTEAIELVKKAKDAHVKRAKALAGRGLNPLTDPLEEMFPKACDEMIAGWQVRAELYKNPVTAEALKNKTLPATLDGLAKAGKELADAKASLKTATDTLATANNNLTTEKNKVTKLEGEVAKLDKEAKAAKTAKETAEGERDTAKKELVVAQTKLGDADKLFKMIGTELEPAKVLPEKWAPADLVKGAKDAAAFAKGKDAEALKLAREELKKAQMEATTANTALTNLKTDYKKEKDTLVENHKTALKAEQKKADDAKKETSDQKTAFEGKLAEQAKAHEKQLADQKAVYDGRLASVISPAEVVDVWLPVLADLRRPADAAPAMRAAKLVLDNPKAGAEDAAKARTANGMALLLKNDLAGAKDQFLLARNSAAYKPAKDKGEYWAAVVDRGLEAIADPQALDRVPVKPPTDPRALTWALDVGIQAYKAGKFDVAAAMFADATKTVPADPLGWYYLGAAQWARGEEDLAKKNIAQGGQRERDSAVPGRTVSAALAPIQGAARTAIDRVRP